MSEHAAPAPWGVLAEFATVEDLLFAAREVRGEGYTRFDAHTPIPVHGLDEAMGIRATRIPWVVLGGGAAGLALALLMQWWMNAADYPFFVAGKPLFALPPAIPISFELTVLLAAVGAVAALFVANGWPELYHPLLGSRRFRRATSDRFFISIEAGDPRYDPERTPRFLEALGATAVEEVWP
jgi:hypothetical protein